MAISNTSAYVTADLPNIINKRTKHRYIHSLVLADRKKFAGRLGFYVDYKEIKKYDEYLEFTYYQCE